MITGIIKQQIDRIWDAFWSGGISNPLEVIEQITYLLFLKRLDELQTLEENKALRLKKPVEQRAFPRGKDPKGRRYEDLRWSKFKNFAPAEMYEIWPTSSACWPKAALATATTSSGPRRSRTGWGSSCARWSAWTAKRPRRRSRIFSATGRCARTRSSSST
jgi:hypothetical protein